VLLLLSLISRSAVRFVLEVAALFRRETWSWTFCCRRTSFFCATQTVLNQKVDCQRDLAANVKNFAANCHDSFAAAPFGRKISSK
jgi:hypothetical protein